MQTWMHLPYDSLYFWRTRCCARHLFLMMLCFFVWGSPPSFCAEAVNRGIQYMTSIVLRQTIDVI